MLARAPDPTYGVWSPKTEASCENLVCAWTCDDGPRHRGRGSYDQDVYDRCKAANKPGTLSACL